MAEASKAAAVVLEDIDLGDYGVMDVITPDMADEILNRGIELR